VVGHCLVVGQGEEWGIGGRPGPARIGMVPTYASGGNDLLKCPTRSGNWIFGKNAVVMCGK